MPADGPADGWQHLPDGRASPSTSSFSQRDVDVGAVWYQRLARGAQRDGFDLWVSREAACLRDSQGDASGGVAVTMLEIKLCRHPHSLLNTGGE